MGRTSHVFMSWWHDETYSLNICSYTGNHPRTAASFSYFQVGEIWYISQIIYIYIYYISRQNYTYIYICIPIWSLWIPWVISSKSHFFETRERRWGMLSITTTCSEICFHQRLDSENCPEHQVWRLPKILATECPENFLDPPSLNMDNLVTSTFKKRSIPRMGIQNQANSLEQSIQDKARGPKMEGPHGAISVLLLRSGVHHLFQGNNPAG